MPNQLSCPTKFFDISTALISQRLLRWCRAIRRFLLLLLVQIFFQKKLLPQDEPITTLYWGEIFSEEIIIPISFVLNFHKRNKKKKPQKRDISDVVHKEKSTLKVRFFDRINVLNSWLSKLDWFLWLIILGLLKLPVLYYYCKTTFIPKILAHKNPLCTSFSYSATFILDTVQDFLIMLGIKPRMHL